MGGSHRAPVAGLGARPRSGGDASAEGSPSHSRSDRRAGRVGPRTDNHRTYLRFLAACACVEAIGYLATSRLRASDPREVRRRAATQLDRGQSKGRRRPRRKGRDEGTERADAEGGAADPEGRPPRGPAGLSCADHGGPTDEVAEEMVYWRDVPSDAEFVSPFGRGAGERKRKYLTFEKDGAGFNNVRMSFETMVVMAHAMGRTLVLPPSQGIYHLDKIGAHFSFEDFYHMEQVGREHRGFDIIPMKDFLKLEAMNGNLKNKTTGKVSFPPDNRTDWDGMYQKPLREWLRDVTLTPLDWSPRRCIAAFPSNNSQDHFQELEDMLAEIKRASPSWKEYVDKPTAVDAPPIDRLREAASSGYNNLCIYDQTMQEAPVVHFMCYKKLKLRMLTHFYGFLFFEDWRQGLWSKRFVRDHLRYTDAIQCAAARVVAAVRKLARNRDPSGNPNGDFDSFQIRRGDFKGTYKATQLRADEIYSNSREEIPENATVFVATDHKDRPFFDPLSEHYKLVFLNDFESELKDVNRNFYGMIDQLVASRGRMFFGCIHSTFSSYIFRIRGYHSQKDRTAGWERGVLLNSFYYTGEKHKHVYAQYFPAKRPLYTREFPISWRDIDRGIDDAGRSVGRV